MSPASPLADADLQVPVARARALGYKIGPTYAGGWRVTKGRRSEFVGHAFNLDQLRTLLDQIAPDPMRELLLALDILRTQCNEQAEEYLAKAGEQPASLDEVEADVMADVYLETVAKLTVLIDKYGKDYR